MKNRIQGLDVARALAVIGMIIVNFKTVFGDSGEGWLKLLTSLFDGKAAATFVVLAGVGIALMSNRAIQNADEAQLAKIKKKMTKRALFLFVLGTSYLIIWPADILHYYGLYILITLFFITRQQSTIFWSSIGIILTYPFLMLALNYDTGWDFNTLDYMGFWTPNGFIRNLFFNGFHPIIPWVSFMLFGLWLGKHDLTNKTQVQSIFKASFIAFIIIQLLSIGSIELLSEGNPLQKKELTEVLGTSPMPPLPIYMFNGVATALMVITGCIVVTEKFKATMIIQAFIQTGQLALTFYVAHIVIGMGLIEIASTKTLGNYSLFFSVTYALFFCLCCIIFAAIWTKKHPLGPMEWLLRKLAG